MGCGQYDSGEIYAAFGILGQDTLTLLPGFHHAFFHETDRKLVTTQIRQFATRLFAAPPTLMPTLRDADKAGYTKAEYDSLQYEPRTLRAISRRAVVATFGRMSRGILLGLRSGFDSGKTLDYVYKNQPRGLTPLGRGFDKANLHTPGWTGIRIRRQHIESLLREAILEQYRAGKNVHVMDAAGGGARYVLETLASLREIPATALLRYYR